MPTSWIVEALEVIEHVCPCLIAGLVDFPARTLCLEAGEETRRVCAILAVDRVVNRMRQIHETSENTGVFCAESDLGHRQLGRRRRVP
jgi:hypothetical protein